MKKAMKVDGASAGPLNAMAPSDEPDAYEVEDAAKTLMKAEDIKGNKKLMPHVHKHIGKQMKSLKALKAMAGMKQNEEDAEESV